MTNTEATAKISLLIIDDKPRNISSLRPYLKEYNVREAYSGSEGLTLARDHQPDIILLDIMMPKMDGFEVLKELQADSRTKSSVVLMLTNRDNPEDVVRAMKAGATDYVVKSDDTRELKDKLTLYTQQKVIPRRKNIVPSVQLHPKNSRHRIFVSYSREDREFANWVKDSLASDTYETWIDHNNIKASQIWLLAIEAALKSCDAMVLVLSPAALKSPFVHAEYLAIINMGKPLIPVLYKECEIPFILNPIHHINYVTDPDSTIKQIKDTLDTIF